MLSTEELSKLFLALEAVAKTGHVAEIERVLAKEIGEKHILEEDFYKILHSMAIQGFTAAVESLIRFKHILPLRNAYYSWKNALYVTIQANYLDIVKLLVTLHEPDCYLLPRITVNNFESVNFLLTLSKIKETLCQSYYYCNLLDDAISIGNLEIIERLLEIKKWNATYKCEGHPSAANMNFWQTAANRNHFAIAYCLANKFKSLIGPQFSLKEYNINGQNIRVDDFLKEYEQEMLLKIAAWSVDCKELILLLPSQLMALIFDYSEHVKSVPSKFTNPICFFKEPKRIVVQQSSESIAMQSSHEKQITSSHADKVNYTENRSQSGKVAMLLLSGILAQPKAKQTYSREIQFQVEQFKQNPSLEFEVSPS